MEVASWLRAELPSTSFLGLKAHHTAFIIYSNFNIFYIAFIYYASEWP